MDAINRSTQGNFTVQKGFYISRGNIQSAWITLWLSCYFFFILNIDFILHIIQILRSAELLNIGFALSVPIVFVAAFNAVFILFSIRFFEKVFFSVLIFMSAIFSYATYHYKVIFDTNMITNILQTHYGEIISYVNLPIIGWLTVFGVLPMIVLCRTHISHFSFVKDLWTKVVIFIVSCLLSGGLVFSYYDHYTTLGRNNSPLIKIIIPFSQLSSIYKHIHSTYFSTPIPYQFLGLDAVNSAKQNTHKKTLFILVVGETARHMNYELNGYLRPTNKHTKPFDPISFQEVSSCGTATAISLPCMFSNLGREQYSSKQAIAQDNLLSILDRAGIQLFWIDNDGGCKGVCEGTPHLHIIPEKSIRHCDDQVCVDEVLIDKLHEKMDTLAHQDTLLVLHLIGSHGPTYYQRYPASHRYFTPDCPRSDIQNCSTETLVNTYDNTILYTDYILAEAIKKLKKSSDQWNTALLYISDHGESLGEKGWYLHGLPYAIAPKEQTQVPLVTWLSPEFVQAKSITPSCLRERAKREVFSHDNLFHSILGLMDISTTVYEPLLDIFKPCRSS